VDRNLLQDGAAYADRWLDYQRTLRQIPGTVVAIQQDDRIVHSKGYGFANLEQQVPMTPQHIFRIASHSKTFTATAIMLLALRGQLRLDDRVADHVDWLQTDVTVRQLLNHVGGITRDGAESLFWQLEKPFPDLAELQQLFEVVLQPNEQFKYSNIGYSLLGQVIEAVSGRSYNDFVTAEIVDRLGLRSTGPEAHAGMAERLVRGYTPWRPSLPRLPVADITTGAMSAATGFYSTAEDLCRYARAHYFGNDELLTDASKREMQQPYWSVPQAENSYGLGFAIHTIGGRRMIGHGGGFPGHSTTTLIDPCERLVVVVLNNTHGTAGLAAPLAMSIVKILDFALAVGSGSTARSTPDQHTGRFMNLWGVTDVARFGSKLVALNPDEAEPTAHATELEEVDSDTLRIGRGSGYGSPGEMVRYERDANGQPARVWVGGASMLPSHAFEADLRARGPLIQLAEAPATAAVTG
jgi:D-alanyl-D-alanine carboxypeptidase